MPIFYGYVRLSEEDESMIGIETQVKTIENYVSSISTENIRFFIDNGYSGVLTVDERPALKELFEILKNDSLSSVNVVVYHPDRLSRDTLIFKTITNYLSDKCVSLHFVTEKGEGNQTLIFFKTIIAEQERKNTIRRVNNYFKYNDNWDSRVGYGWVYNTTTKEKEPHPEEYPVLMMIKDMYTNYSLLTEIAQVLKEKGIKKRDGKNDWTTTNIEFVIKRNCYTWPSETKIDEENKRIYIGSSCSKENTDFKKEGYKVFFEGKKFNFKKEENRSSSDSKEEINRKIKEKLDFWINHEREKYYSNDELVKKIKSEFPCKENTSKRVLWELIRKVRR